jgi:signal transduction histidine kinase
MSGSDRLLRLRKRDDGKGIDPRVLQEGGRVGHWGLPGIRERAKQLAHDWISEAKPERARKSN